MPKDYFICKNCGQKVSLNAIGTQNRNHCPYCLWSLHVDKNKPGDRVEPCHGMMEPVGLVFKNEGVDKYGKKRQGEIMVVHKCQICGKETKNRIAGDDDPKKILEILEKTTLVDRRSSLKYSILRKRNRKEVERQLYGEY